MMSTGAASALRPTRLQHVESGLIGGVDVLEHENRRRSRLQLLDERGGHFAEASPRLLTSVASSPPVVRVMSSSGPSGRGVKSASQAPARRRRRPRVLIGEGPHERRLAHARLAADEYQSAAGAVEDSAKRIL